MLDKCRDFALSTGAAFKVVTTPVFPSVFFNQTGTDWTMVFGDYDMTLPERRLIAYARQHDIELLPMGAYLADQHVPVEVIRTLYYQDGRGHFTPQGHRFFADAIADVYNSGTGTATGR